MRRRSFANRSFHHQQWLVVVLLQSLTTTVISVPSTMEVQADSYRMSSLTEIERREARLNRFHKQRQQRIETYEKQSEVNVKAQPRRKMQSTSGCNLCYDGSTVPSPNSTSDTVPGWTCEELEGFVRGSLATDDIECLEWQTVGFTDCGCTTSPLDEDYCALCAAEDGSVELIPDNYRGLPIPVTETQPTPGLTCSSLVFVEREGGVVPCENLDSYKRYCGCPASTPTSGPAPTPTRPPTQAPVSYAAGQPTPEPGDDFDCYMCPNQKPPLFQSRKLPYLSPPPTPRSANAPQKQPVPGRIDTCGVLAEQSLAINDGATCYAFIFPEIPLDLQSYCGCASAETWDLCSLCLERQPLANPDLSVPGANGMTCVELQEYLRYFTDEESCSAIAEAARDACCTPLPDCPVCGNSIFDYNEEKIYPPFGLRCKELALISNQRNNTCSSIQERFGYYCECANAARPSCSLCGDQLPNRNEPIPPLGPGVTCGEIDDYASLRSADQCEDELSSWAVDVQAYCRCPGFEPRNTCRVSCPSDLFLNSEAGVPGSLLSCGELVNFAEYVTDSGLCLEIQDAFRGCCVVEDELDGDPEGQGRLGGDKEGIISYPFLNKDAAGQEDEEEVHSREFIPSPYGAVSRNYLKDTSAAAVAAPTLCWTMAMAGLATLLAVGGSLL